MLQNIWSLSSKRTGKSQIWFTFAGVISQSCVSLINGEEQEEKKFPYTLIVSSATATKTESTMTGSMQALIFSSKALVLRKFGSTNHTLNSIDTRNDTTFFLLVFFQLKFWILHICGQDRWFTPPTPPTPPPKKNWIRIRMNKYFWALSQMLIEFVVRSTDFSSTQSATASWSQFQIISGQRHFFWLDFKFSDGKQ